MYTYVYIYIQNYTYMYTYISIYILVYMSTYTHTHTPSSKQTTNQKKKRLKIKKNKAKKNHPSFRKPPVPALALAALVLVLSGGSEARESGESEVHRPFAFKWICPENAEPSRAPWQPQSPGIGGMKTQRHGGWRLAASGCPMTPSRDPQSYALSVFQL